MATSLPAVTRASDREHVQSIALDYSVQMDIEKVKPWRGAPMPKQTRINVLTLQRLSQQRVVVQINLTDLKIVDRSPIGVHVL